MPFKTGTLTHLLQNLIYIGKVSHRNKWFDGEHEAILSKEIFDRAQAIFAVNRNNNKLGKKSCHPSLLTEMITGPDDRPMSPTSSTKGNRKYRYYFTRANPGDRPKKIWRLPAGELEELVIGQIATHLKQPTLENGQDASELAEQIKRRTKLALGLQSMSTVGRRTVLLALQAQVKINPKTIQITIHPPHVSSPITIAVKAKLVSRGCDLKLAVPPADEPKARESDPILLRLIAHAFAAQDLLLREIKSPMISGYSDRHLQQLTRLSYLAPDIISAIIDGSQPVDLTGRKLLRMGNLPLSWPEQRAALGFEAA